MDRRKFIGVMASGAVAVPALGLSESLGSESAVEKAITPIVGGDPSNIVIPASPDNSSGMFRLKLYVYNGFNYRFSEKALRGLVSRIREPVRWHLDSKLVLEEVTSVIAGISFYEGGLYGYGSFSGDPTFTKLLAREVNSGDAFLAAGYWNLEFGPNESVEKMEFSNHFVFLSKPIYNEEGFEWLNCKV